MSRSEAVPVYREGHYLDIKQGDGKWTVGVVKGVDPVKGYNVHYEDNGKPWQLWLNRTSERLAPFRSVSTEKVLNSVLRKAGATIAEIAQDIRVVVSRSAGDAMSAVQTYRGEFLYRVLELLESQPNQDSERVLWTDALTCVVTFSLQWLRSHLQSASTWLSLLKSKEAYLTSVDRAQASAWPELFEILSKALLAKSPVNKFSRSFRSEPAQYALSQNTLQEAFDLLYTAFAQGQIPFHMMGNYPVWELFPVFGTSETQKYVNMLENVYSKQYFEPRYCDFSMISVLIEKLTPICTKISPDYLSRLQLLSLEIAKELGKDRDRLETRIQSIQIYTLLIEKRPEQGLRGDELADNLLEAVRNQMSSETNTEAIVMSWSVYRFLASEGRLNPADIKSLVHSQGHESIQTAKFHLATKLASSLQPDSLEAVVQVWSEQPLSHTLITAMKEFTIAANESQFRHMCFLTRMLDILGREMTTEYTAEILNAVSEIVRLPSFETTQSQVLAALAGALMTSGPETIFGFTHLLRECRPNAVAELYRRYPNLLQDIIGLAVGQDASSPVLGTILDLILELLELLGKDCLTWQHIQRLHELIKDPVDESRAEQYFEWLLKVVSRENCYSSDLMTYCTSLLSGEMLPTTLYIQSGKKTFSFFQHIFLERNSNFFQSVNGMISAIVKIPEESEIFGLYTIFQLSLFQPNTAVQDHAIAFLTQLLYRSQHGVKSLLEPYLLYTVESLQTNTEYVPAQVAGLRSLVLVVEYYRQITEIGGYMEGPVVVNVNTKAGKETYSFQYDAKLGHLRKSLGRPYYTIALQWQQQWYSFIHDDCPLTSFGNPISFNLHEDQYYAHLDPLRAIASGYAVYLVPFLDSKPLQSLLWTLFSQIISTHCKEFIQLYGGVENIFTTFRESPSHQLLALAVIEASECYSDPNASTFTMSLLQSLSASLELLNSKLEPSLKRAFCCKLVTVACRTQPWSGINKKPYNDQVLAALFTLLKVYLTNENTEKKEEFRWLDLVKSWVKNRNCSVSSVISDFLTSNIIKTVFFTSISKEIQQEFSEILSNLCTPPFSSGIEIDRCLIAGLQPCLGIKTADTEVYFRCLKEALGRGLANTESVAMRIVKTLEGMQELTVSERTLEGLFMVVQQEVAAGRLKDTEKLAKRLTTHYLFPSSEQKYPLCTSNSTQEAGFSLLTDICISSSPALKAVLDSLERFHTVMSWRKGSLKSWVVPAQEEKSLPPFVGLRNLGATCYMNSVLQQFFMLTQFRNNLTQIANLPGGVTAEVVKLLLKLQYSAKPYVQTKGLCGVYLNWGEPVNPREQMDVEEFLTGLLTKMEEELQPLHLADVIQRTFQTTMVSIIHGQSPCTHSSEREETQFAIPIEVKNKRSLRESIQALISKETMTGDSAYNCENCGRKVTAEKTQLFRKLPEVLMFALRRFEYSVELGRRKKINDYFEFEEEIDMKEYLAPDLKSISSLPKKSVSVYQLTGIIIHIGEAEAGHYVALTKSGDLWLQMNDVQVTPLTLQERKQMAVGGQDGPFAQTSAYILLYQKSHPGSEIHTLQTIRNHPGSQANIISHKNEDYLYKKSVFRVQYRNFVLGLLTHLRVDERLLRFAISDFLTIHSRCQIPESKLLIHLYEKMRENAEIQRWFSQSITSDLALKEFIIDCPHLLVRKFVTALFYQSMENSDLQSALGRLIAVAGNLSPPLNERHASLFEMMYSVTRKNLQLVTGTELPEMMVAQILRKEVRHPPFPGAKAPIEWGYTSTMHADYSPSDHPVDSKPNYSFQIAILHRCLQILRPETIQEIMSREFIQEVVHGAYNKFGGLKLAQLYMNLASKHDSDVLTRYLECLCDYFQVVDYDRYRVGTVQFKRILQLTTKKEVVSMVLALLMRAIDGNRGYVLASATLIRLLYKLIVRKSEVLQWFKANQEAGRMIDTWEREYSRFSMNSSTSMTLLKSPQYYQPSIYLIIPDISTILAAFTSRRFPNLDYENDSDAEVYEARFTQTAELLLPSGPVKVEVEKNMEVMIFGSYVEAGSEKTAFIAMEDDRLMPEHTKIPTNS